MSNMQFKNYDDVEDMLTSRGQRKIGNNTYLRRRDGITSHRIGLQYHNTDVVTFTPDGLTLTSGGWRTVTTKERINWALSSLGVRLFTHQGTWYLEKGFNWDTRKATLEQTPVFYDGIRVRYDGTIHANSDEQTAEQTNRKATMKLIDRYVKGFAWDKIGEPGGDCWLCSMRTENDIAWGDLMKDTGHLVSHLEEKYYMHSLCYNALRYSTYNNVGAAYWSDPARRNNRDGYRVEVIKRALRRYFKGMLLDRTGAAKCNAKS